MEKLTNKELILIVDVFSKCIVQNGRAMLNADIDSFKQIANQSSLLQRAIVDLVSFQTGEKEGTEKEIMGMSHFIGSFLVSFVNSLNLAADNTAKEDVGVSARIRDSAKEIESVIAKFPVHSPEELEKIKAELAEEGLADSEVKAVVIKE